MNPSIFGHWVNAHRWETLILAKLALSVGVWRVLCLLHPRRPYLARWTFALLVTLLTGVMCWNAMQLLGLG